MIIYVEKRAKSYEQTSSIISKFPKASIVYIDHYKNVFDKNTAGLGEKKSIIIAKLCSPAVTEAPSGYGHTEHAYFFKTSLNCIYDCDYCFLKGAFKTEHMVFFVNYEDIKAEIDAKITELKKQNISRDIWFYSSDYSDIQGMDMLSGFNHQFISFFEKYDGVKMEIRTKSGNIQSLLETGEAPKNTEVAFSLNPQELIERYESGTASLSMRITAINTLLSAGWKVGIRLLPLLPVKNYQDIYTPFFQLLSGQISMQNIYSSFAAGLLFTKQDYKVMIKKYPSLDILYYLDLETDNFYRESKEVRDWFYKEIKKIDKKCLLCLEQ